MINYYKKFTEINLFFSFSLALVGSILSPYIKSLGFSAWQISLMFSVFPFVNIVFLPLLGKLADSLSRSVVIWFGIWLEIIALLFYLFSTHWYLVVMARFLDAVAASLVSLIILAKIEDGIRDEQKRGKKTGDYLSLGYIGGLIGPLVGSFLADFFFVKFPFLVAIIVLLVLSFYVRPRELSSIKKYKLRLSELSWLEEVKVFLKERQLKGMAIMGMVMHATNPAMKVFLPIIIVSELGMSYQAIGIAMFVYGIVHLAQGLFGRLSDRWGHNKMVVAGALLTAVSLSLISVASSFFLLLVLLFLQGVGISMWNVSAWSLMSKVGEQKNIEAQVVTSYYSLAKIGSLISFLASSFVVKQFGIDVIFVVNGILIIIGVGIAWHLLKLNNSLQFKY